eukprot:COSAG04_NODE_22542_length_353_cov_0.763780_2_plen_25_part_01
MLRPFSSPLHPRPHLACLRLVASIA